MIWVSGLCQTHRLLAQVRVSSVLVSPGLTPRLMPPVSQQKQYCFHSFWGNPIHTTTNSRSGPRETKVMILSKFNLARGYLQTQAWFTYSWVTREPTCSDNSQKLQAHNSLRDLQAAHPVWESLHRGLAAQKAKAFELKLFVAYITLERGPGESSTFIFPRRVIACVSQGYPLLPKGMF